MAWCRNIPGLFLIFIVACSSSPLLNNAETHARRHMAVGDTLEHSSAFREATLEYAVVAEQYPTTSVHAAAVRKTALLYSSPLNPIANDSISRYWLTRYLEITKSPEEKQIIQMYLKMVDYAGSLRDSLADRVTASDSLAVIVRKHTSEVSARGKRIQELETELQKAADELKKLKEIDVRISKSRGKNKP